MKNRTRLTAAASFAAVILLAGCSAEPETVGNGTNDPDAKTIADAAPVELPPMLTASRTYRCKDNSLVYIDFFSDNKTANLRTEKDGTPTVLTAAEPGKPFEADGYALTGSGAEVTLARPGKGSETCKA